jgi:hypothetical protein
MTTTTPYIPPSFNDHPPTFTLTLISPTHPALLKLTSHSFDNLREWLPWIEWDGHWQETYPLNTLARIPLIYIQETITRLKMHGYIQTNNMLMARF